MSRRDYMDHLGEYRLEATYDARTGELLVVASAVALCHLRDMISELIQATAPGAHFHLDRTTGLNGDVASIAIEKGEG